MATAKVVTTPNPQEVLVHLVEVANQVKASKDVNKESASKARGMRAWVNFLRDSGVEQEDESVTYGLGPWGEELVKLGAIEGDVISIANDLETYAELLAPKASELWDQTEVKQGLTFLEAIVPFGVLSAEEQETLNDVAETLSAARKGGGARAERTPQERIEGRPAFVISSYIDSDGDVARLGVNGGNLPNSVSNIKNAAIKFINKNLPSGQTVTQSQAEELKKAVSNAVTSGKETSALGITFTPSETDPR